MVRVREFVSQHSHFFTATCTDGSHPLVWTQYHFHYKELFERQLADVLQGFDVLEDDFANFCDWLKVNAEIFEDDTEGLYPFLSSITASLDYETFLGVMFEEVRRSNGGVQQIDVVVPDGMTAGEVLLVEYLGAHYELIIPEGCEAGMVFQTSVTLPN
ncbi:unnamed protein product [Durusdinium trenchii]